MDQSSIISIPAGGMVERKGSVKKGLSCVWPSLRQSIMRFIDQVTTDEDSAWPFCESPGATELTDLETTVWAVMILRLLGAEARLKAIADRAVSLADRFYDARTGLYQDSNSHQKGQIGTWRLHNDGCCRMMLNFLDVSPKPFPRGLDQLRLFPWAPQPGERINSWLEKCWRQNPRSGAKEIFQYLLLYCGLQRIETQSQFDGHVWRIVAFLESKRDPESGFIGMGEGVSLGWAMRGHRNLAHGFYWRKGLGESFLEKMIDSTLTCRREDGLFHDGSMCANLDAVHLLAEYGLRIPYRREDILAAIRRCISSVFRYLSVPCGGFRWDLRSDKLTVGTAFVLETMRHWEAIDDRARGNPEYAESVASGHEHNGQHELTACDLNP